MRAFWRQHSLTIILILLAVVVTAISTWASWHEFVHNEQAGKDAHFFGPTFAAYWVMQVGLNYLAELLGLITIVLLTKHFRERFSAESR
jgi:hypothetical protein